MNKIITKNELIDWLNDIGQRIFEIKNSRKQYDSFIEDYNNGKFKDFNIEFCWWIRRNYESNIVILLTGLLESSKRHEDDLNFQKFLDRVDKYGLENLKLELLADKPQYFSDFNNIVLETPKDDDFLEIQRKNYLEENYFKNLSIEQDIECINNNFLKLKDFRDKQIAHFTNNTDDMKITNSDLDGIINEIISIFDKYALIIRNTNFVFD
ncbi:MAG: hypothetical protein LUB59_07590 [Candidatus Gastranaerophilales bacterium]|nr:hypothetical protein [Candidatus Gastranaerophilales bacterium]